jgi:hypothetical protein
MDDAAGPVRGDGGVVEISWLGLGLAAALILVQGAVSARWGPLTLFFLLGAANTVRGGSVVCSVEGC